MKLEDRSFVRKYKTFTSGQLIPKLKIIAV